MRMPVGGRAGHLDAATPLFPGGRTISRSVGQQQAT